jgi:adenylate cyclase
MPGALRIQVFENDRLVLDQEVSGPIELGRQKELREEYGSCKFEKGRHRIVIARLNEDTVSREHVHLDLIGERLRVRNRSERVPIRLPDGRELGARGSCELDLPAALGIGPRKIVVQSQASGGSSVFGLPERTLAPGQLPRTTAPFPTLIAAAGVEVEALLGWLQATIGVLQSAAGSTDFLNKAAQAVVEIVGCDAGRVLLLKDVWKLEVQRLAPGAKVDPNWEPSQTVLERVRREKRTFYQAPDLAASNMTKSLLGVDYIVAAPILDRAGEVIGVLYGDCRSDIRNPTRARIGKLEAMLVQVLAEGVAAGLARLEQEKAAIEADVRFGQFFTPELARYLAEHPDLLHGRDTEVTVLFCDIRGFSGISERLGPARTVEWIGDVMGTLSQRVLDHRGVLVDYIGDELMAMWGAPEEQPDHAELACRAALEMLAAVPDLNARWEAELEESLALGIGINTGVARVGNTGSRQKFKYGPLGHTVNLASRVEGATKYLRRSLLITESTRAGLGDAFATRRLCQARVKNIERTVGLYELVATSTSEWQAYRVRYEQALNEFEQGRFRPAARILGELMTVRPDDGAALVLLLRTVNQMVAEAAAFDPVWEVPGK